MSKLVFGGVNFPHFPPRHFLLSAELPVELTKSHEGLDKGMGRGVS